MHNGYFNPMYVLSALESHQSVWPMPMPTLTYMSQSVPPLPLPSLHRRPNTTLCLPSILFALQQRQDLPLLHHLHLQPLNHPPPLPRRHVNTLKHLRQPHLPRLPVRLLHLPPPRTLRLILFVLHPVKTRVVSAAVAVE